MNNMKTDCCENTDREIWRGISKGYYSPSIHVTEDGSIGINCTGHVIVVPVETWHDWGEKMLFLKHNTPSWIYNLIMQFLSYSVKKEEIKQIDKVLKQQNNCPTKTFYS